MRRMIDRIVDSFSPVRYPWFKDEFVHPDKLKNSYTGEPLVNLFEGFQATGHNQSFISR